MKVLLDECLPRRLKNKIIGHDVRTVPEQGWAGKRNGELIKLSADKFDVFITIDKNFSAQQNVTHSKLAIIILTASSNRFQDIDHLVPKIFRALDSIRLGEVVKVERIQ